MSPCATTWLIYVFLIVLGKQWATVQVKKLFPAAQDDRFIVGFGLFMVFVDSKKNIEHHQSYPLSKYPVKASSGKRWWMTLLIYSSFPMCFLCVVMILGFSCVPVAYVHMLMRLCVFATSHDFPVFWQMRQQFRKWLPVASCTSIQNNDHGRFLLKLIVLSFPWLTFVTVIVVHLLKKKKKKT